MACAWLKLSVSFFDKLLAIGRCSTCFRSQQSSRVETFARPLTNPCTGEENNWRQSLSKGETVPHGSQQYPAKCANMNWPARKIIMLNGCYLLDVPKQRCLVQTARPAIASSWS